MKIRKNLEVEIKPWIAKTKKDFIKLYKEKGQYIEEDELYDLILYPYINIEKDIYLSSLEKQYILIEIKKISGFNKVQFQMSCDKCEKLFDVNSTLDDVTHYHIGEFPAEIKVKDNVYKFFDVKLSNTVNEAKIKYPDEPPSYIIMLLSIREINDKKIESLDEVKEFIELLPLTEFEELEEFFFNKKSDLELGQEIECPHCGFKRYYNFDIIPGFFDELLPKVT